MQITIHSMDEKTLSRVNECNEPFTIDSRLVLSAEGGKIRYTIVPLPPYEKRYRSEERDYAGFIHNPDRTVFLAYVDDGLAGQLRVFKNWNAYAYVDDVAVKQRFRRHGVGRALIRQVIAWAREKGFPGLMLETQDNNVVACRLYETCGFQLGGFDRYLYKGLHPGTGEIALYWYLLFPLTEKTASAVGN